MQYDAGVALLKGYPQQVGNYLHSDYMAGQDMLVHPQEKEGLWLVFLFMLLRYEFQQWRHTHDKYFLYWIDLDISGASFVASFEPQEAEDSLAYFHYPKSRWF